MSFPTKKLWIETVNSIQTKLVMRGWPKKWGKTKLAPKWFILVQILDISDSNVKIKISYRKTKIMNVDKIKKILPFIKEEEKAEENDIDNLNF